MDLDTLMNNPIWLWKYRKTLLYAVTGRFTPERARKHCMRCELCAFRYDDKLVLIPSLKCPVGMVMFNYFES